MIALKSLLEQKADRIQKFFFDVDGVMTPQGAVTIYDVREGSDLSAFERKDGITSIRLVPCDEYGTPFRNVVEYVAGYEGEPIMEGYRFDPRDGKVVEYLVEHKFPVYFVSGRNSPCVRKRALALGATPFLGVMEKLSVINGRGSVPLADIMFVGDGIQDCSTLVAVREAGGIAIAPADASPEALDVAEAVTQAKGGEGVLDEILRIFFQVRGIKLT